MHSSRNYCAKSVIVIEEWLIWLLHCHYWESFFVPWVLYWSQFVQQRVIWIHRINVQCKVLFLIMPYSVVWVSGKAQLAINGTGLYSNLQHGGRDRGGQGGRGPSNNLVGGAIMYLAPPIFCTGIKNFNRRFNAKGREYVPHSVVLDVCTL